jgi:hypothetical protein
MMLLMLVAVGHHRQPHSSSWIRHRLCRFWNDEAFVVGFFEIYADRKRTFVAEDLHKIHHLFSDDVLVTTTQHCLNEKIITFYVEIFRDRSVVPSCKLVKMVILVLDISNSTRSNPILGIVFLIYLIWKNVSKNQQSTKIRVFRYFQIRVGTSPVAYCLPRFANSLVTVACGGVRCPFVFACPTSYCVDKELKLFLLTRGQVRSAKLRTGRIVSYEL